MGNELTIVLFLFLNFGSYSLSENNFFEKGKKKYDEQKYEESKFLFQRSIVFNPKDQNSYLYLAKIYNFEENKKEEKKKKKKKKRGVFLKQKKKKKKKKKK